jgi:hypothetical protein
VSMSPSSDWLQKFKLDVSAIRANLAQKQNVFDVIKSLDLEDFTGEFSRNGTASEGVTYRFNKVEEFLKQYPDPTFGDWQRFMGAW